MLKKSLTHSFFRSYVLWLFWVVAAMLFANCRSDQPFVRPWNQFHADPANSGQLLIGTKPANGGTGTSAQVGAIAYSSPVIAPDGSVYVSTFSRTQESGGSELLRLSVGRSISVRKRIPLGGQLTTPAVDAAGNVYVTQFFEKNADSHLLSFGPDDGKKWDIPMAKGSGLAPPKVLDVSGGSLIFEAYAGGSPPGGHVLVANDQGKLLGDTVVCQHLVANHLFSCCTFQVPPLDPSPPYVEQPAVGIGVVQTLHGPERYLALATNQCGLTFFRLELGATVANMPTLTDFAFQETNSALYSSPAISVSGILVIADSDKHVTAYDLTTGKEKWHHDTSAFVIGTPTLLPTAINFVYVASYDRLTKWDLDTGEFVGEIPVIGSTDASPAAGGSNIFVSTRSGLFTYNLDLKLLAFAPLAGGFSSPALGPSGEVMVASHDGSFYVFPGP